MPGRKGARHIAPMVRAGFEQAIKALAKKGGVTSLADIWEELIVTDPAKALEVLSKYVPKEMMIEVEDARPFAFTDKPMQVDEWLKHHGPDTVQ